MTDERLVQAVQAVIGPDEQVVGAFVGIVGPRPGIETFTPLVLAAMLAVTSNTWAAAAAAALGGAGVVLARRMVTVVRTNSNVLVIDNGRRSRPRPTTAVSRLPLDALAGFHDDGDAGIQVGHQHLWLLSAQQDEARRLSRLAGVTAPITG